MQEQQFIPYNAVSHLGTGSTLVLAPHADDEVFGCGGAIAAQIAHKEWVQVVVISDGAAGGESEIRQGESLAASEVLGVSEIEFWHLPDRELVLHVEVMRERIIALIDAAAIQWIYAPSLSEIHPDHRAVAEAAIAAVRERPEVTLACYEISAPLMPNYLVDITKYWPLKQSAMDCFVSQQASHDYTRYIRGLNQFRTMSLPREVEFAEAFWVMQGEELLHAEPVQTLFPVHGRLIQPDAVQGDFVGNMDGEIQHHLQRLAQLFALKQHNTQQLQTHIEQLEQQVETERQEIMAVKSSKTWRWTEWLRRKT